LFSSTLFQPGDYDNLSGRALGRGIDAFMKQDYAGAVKEFKRSIALSPYSEYAGKSFEYLAYAYLNQNMESDAITTYKQSLSLNPSNDSAHLNLGNIYFRNNQFKEAEAEYSLAVRLNPASASNRFALGMAYLATEKYSQAEVQFKRVTQITPRDANGYDALGQALRKLERYDEAVIQFRKAITLDKKNADAYLDLGYTYADMKKLDEAQQQADLLKKIDPGKANDLQDYIQQASDPKLYAVISSQGFPLSAGRGTVISTLDPELEVPNASKSYTLKFMFSKNMDPASVQNPWNWQIRRSTSRDPGGAYNLGLAIPSTEVTSPLYPYRVTYDAAAKLAEITFQITQNSSGTGTIDPSHLIFKFNGVDAYGKAMDPTADEYSGISKIV
jgi:tetratricopeptide (TPR) repeat protein